MDSSSSNSLFYLILEYDEKREYSQDPQSILKLIKNYDPSERLVFYSTDFLRLIYSTKSLLTWSRPFSSCRTTALLWGEPIQVEEIIERIASCYGPATTNDCSELLMKERIHTLCLNRNETYLLNRLHFFPRPLVFSLEPDTDSLNFF